VELNSLKELVILECDPKVPPGLVVHLLQEREIPFHLVLAHAGESLPSAKSAAAVIVLGGAMGAGDDEAYPFLRELKELIRECVALDTPFLGICLGGQLLSEALGTPVVTGRRGEKGICRVSLTPEGAADPLFLGISPEFLTYQWHNDSFDLPAHCQLLASSDLCPHQAIRHGVSVYGIQFHPEVTAAIVTSWHGDASRSARHIPLFLQAEEEYLVSSRTLLHNFLRIARLIPEEGV
jgi:GMP synthase (glutamine-hydrolysing)